MAINIPNINTSIIGHNYNNPDRDAGVRALLMGIQAGNDAAVAGDQAGLKEKAAVAEHARDLKGAQERLAQAKAFSEEHPDKGISISKEGASIHAADPLAKLLGIQRLQEAKDARMDRQVQGISDRMQKSAIPETLSKLDALAGSMKEGDGKLKSVGGLKNLVPDWGAGIAEFLGVMPKGSSQERQNLAAIENAVGHSQFGSAQTASEVARLRAQLGRNIGSSEEDMRKAIDGLRGTMASQGENVIHGANPAAVEKFKQQGGRVDFAAPAPTKQMSFEDFKALKKAGKL